MKRKILALVSAFVIVLAAGCGNGTQAQNNGGRGAVNNPGVQSVNDVIQQQIAKEDAKKNTADNNTAASTDDTKQQGTDTDSSDSSAQTTSAGNDNSSNASSSSVGATADNKTEDNTTADNTGAGNTSDENGNAGVEPSTVADENIDYDHPDIDLTQMSSTMAYAEMANMFYDREKTQDYVGKVVKLSGTYAISDPDQYGDTYHFIVYWDATACCQLGGEFVMKNADDYPEVFSDLTVVGVYRPYIDPADGQEYVHIDACIPVNS